jgi:MazG family protein
LLNETFELDQALRRRDKAAIAEELGDYLFMGLFLADVARKELGITVQDSLEGMVAKLKQRHPHVYGKTRVRDADEVLVNWERIKRRQKKGESLLPSVPVAMPALRQAQLIQERCRRVGFDWEAPERVLDKVEEEMRELEHELRRRPRNRARVKDELGDMLFVLVNLCRHLGVDAEGALKDANIKFTRRFQAIEAHFARRGRDLSRVSLGEMEQVWQRSKGKRKKTKGKARPQPGAATRRPG